jgi:hypothetical protein
MESSDLNELETTLVPSETYRAVFDTPNGGDKIEDIEARINCVKVEIAEAQQQYDIASFGRDEAHALGHDTEETDKTMLCLMNTLSYLHDELSSLEMALVVMESEKNTIMTQVADHEQRQRSLSALVNHKWEVREDWDRIHREQSAEDTYQAAIQRHDSLVNFVDLQKGQESDRQSLNLAEPPKEEDPKWLRKMERKMRKENKAESYKKILESYYQRISDSGEKENEHINTVASGASNSFERLQADATAEGDGEKEAEKKEIPTLTLSEFVAMMRQP